jgi:hypothetical protein
MQRPGVPGPFSFPSRFASPSHTVHPVTQSGRSTASHHKTTRLSRGETICETTGTVENAIGHTQATALKGRRFESIEEQNEHLEHWEKKWAAPRIHGSARRQVEAMFQEERPHLLALPLLGMQYFTEEQRTVYDDTCIRVDHSSYAARPAPFGSLVLVRLFEHRLEIRDLKTQALLRTHERVDRPQVGDFEVAIGAECN